MQIYACEESNQHSGAFIFLLGQLFASIPFLFLISISSSLVFYFLVGLRDEFSMLMYFVLNFFACLLVNEGLVLAVTSIWQDIFWSVLIFVSIQVSLVLNFNVLKILFTTNEVIIFSRKSRIAILLIYWVVTLEIFPYLVFI